MTDIKKNIFIIEDDAALRLALVSHLKRNYKVSEAEDGEQAIDMLSTLRPDLILLDIKMPKINGIEVLKYMRRKTMLKNTPVIIISQFDAPTLITQGLLLGAKDYLAKANYTLEDIAEMIKTRLR